MLVGTLAGSEGTNMAILGIAEPMTRKFGIVELTGGEVLVGISVKGEKEVRSIWGEVMVEM